MGKSLEHKMLQGLVFYERTGRTGRRFSQEGGFSDWSDWSDWSENLLRRTGPLKRPSLRKKENPAPLGEVRDGLIF